MLVATGFGRVACCGSGFSEKPLNWPNILLLRAADAVPTVEGAGVGVEWPRSSADCMSSVLLGVDGTPLVPVLVLPVVVLTVDAAEVGDCALEAAPLGWRWDPWLRFGLGLMVWVLKLNEGLGEGAED